MFPWSPDEFKTRFVILEARAPGYPNSVSELHSDKIHEKIIYYCTVVQC